MWRIQHSRNFASAGYAIFPFEMIVSVDRGHRFLVFSYLYITHQCLELGEKLFLPALGGNGIICFLISIALARHLLHSGLGQLTGGGVYELNLRCYSQGFF